MFRIFLPLIVGGIAPIKFSKGGIAAINFEILGIAPIENLNSP